jgi:hypothetical protein
MVPCSWPSLDLHFGERNEYANYKPCNIRLFPRHKSKGKAVMAETVHDCFAATLTNSPSLPLVCRTADDYISELQSSCAA